MKEQKTLQKKLTERKFKRPSRFINFIYYVIGSMLDKTRYHCEYTIKDNINDCKGPCFLIWNHLSRIDHIFLMKATYPRRLSILAGYNEFFRGHLQFVFKLMHIIPKKNFTYDLTGLRGIHSIINQGGTVTFSPEGMSSIYGVNQPIVPGTGRFLKSYHIPVYFCKLRGSYLTSTKICLDEREGKCTAELSLLFTPEQLDAMTGEEIDAKINEAFRSNDYEWGLENNIHWKNKGGMCKQLNTVCYKCPKCGSELQMRVDPEGNSIKCAVCGNGARVDDMYRFVPFNDTCILPNDPSEWVQNERADIIKEIRENGKYIFSDFVKVGELPKYEYVKNKDTSVICGDGMLVFDHEGIHFKGKKHGEDWSFDLSYANIFSLVVVTDTTHFALYVNSEFYEFYPQQNSTGKMLLITEEMHRLHVNTWKNFPWNDYLYKDYEK